MNVIDILSEGAMKKASDVHIVPGCPPLFRINGELIRSPNFSAFSAEEAQNLIFELLSDEHRARLAQDYSVDFSITTHEMRYRGSALYQRNGIEAVMRLIPMQIPGPEEILLPAPIIDLTNLKGGLILITGPTGSGKSTTLACMIDLINQRRRGNIITIEDPIEFIFTNKNCVVSQREIGIHAPNFSSALRSVMRHNPDVVMIGEMRDLETIAATITLAETGHLVFATLHSIDAAQAVDRIIDVFPARQQQQIRTQLAGVLQAVIAQTLLLRTNGRGRVALREVMIVNSAMSNLIRMGRNHEIAALIEMGVSDGMISSDRALADLTKKGLIRAPDKSR